MAAQQRYAVMVVEAVVVGQQGWEITSRSSNQGVNSPPAFKGYQRLFRFEIRTQT
jgi:hypothetical protein